MTDPDWKLIAVQRGVDLDAMKQALAQIAYATPKTVKECAEIAQEALDIVGSETGRGK